MNDALQHINDFQKQHPDFNDVKTKYKGCTQAKNYQYIVIFKRWGTDSGPDYAIDDGAGSYQYYSDNAGQEIISNAFEAFGNWFFGMVCTFGGFSADATKVAAAYSSAEYGGNIFDDPNDRPQVDAGIASGQRYLQQSQPGYGPVKSAMQLKAGC